MKEEFINNIKEWTKDYMDGLNSEYGWRHYSDETWGKIYDLGNVYFTNQLSLNGKPSQTRKIHAEEEKFVEDIKREMERDKKKGFDVEYHILGAVIQEGIGYNQDGETFDGGYIRYIKIKKNG